MKTDRYSSLEKIIKSNMFSSIFILVDENSHRFCLDVFIKKTKISDYNEIKIISGEENKNINTCIEIWDKLNYFKADRNSLFINLGGGVLTDIGGFAASTYLRGIRFVNVPTTLLGMVDASHGGKTGVDFKSLKNQIGVFSEPLEVVLDSDYLKTLSKEEFINGYAEVVKHSLLTKKLELSFDSLSKLDINKDVDFIIENYSEIKNEIVSSDKYESNKRKILNFGHTIGHAIESYSHISDSFKPLRHGESIVIGILTELYISHRMLGFSLHDLKTIKKHLFNYFIKVKFNGEDLDKIYDLLIYDKKNDGNRVNFVLLKKIGEPIIDQEIDKDLFIDSFTFYEK
tara:strand:- start:523 stop:1551 length:1029 start_codon:yes stop_codon:yes gene_type:complete